MKKKKKLKKAILLILPLLIMFYISSCYFVKEIYYYNSSKSFMTYIVYGLIIFTALLMILFTYFGIKEIKENKLRKYILYFIILGLTIGLQFFITLNISKISTSLEKITNKEAGYSSSIVTLKESNISSIKDLEGKKIGMISDPNNIEGYKIPRV